MALSKASRTATRARDKDEPLSGARASESEVEFFDCEQGGEEWKRLHIGVPSASRFKAIMASGRDGDASKTRAKLLYQMAGEILTGEPAETFKNAVMQRGIEMEPEAREHYAFRPNVELTSVGFARRTIGRVTVGCSPDSLVGKDGLLEIKTMAPDMLIELLQSGRFPTEHRAQVHGSLWVLKRQWCDLKIFYRGMPVSPEFRIERDEIFIRMIDEAVQVFDYDLRRLVEKIKDMGGKR